jgi:hypothetical protein
MSANRFPSRFRSTVVVVALLGLFALPAGAANPAKLFPEFAGRKPTLGSITLVADVVVVEDVIGKTEKVYLGDCKDLGRVMLGMLAEDLGHKGYAFSSRRLVSVGNVVSDQRQYRILDRWEQHKEDASRFPVQPPPFYQDSVLCATDSSRAAWHALLNRAWDFEKKKNKPARTLDDIVALHDVIGTDYAAVALVVGTKIPMGKKFGQGMLSGATVMHASGSTGSGTTSVSFGVDFEQYSGTGIKFLVVDCRSGEVLWADGDHEDFSLDEGRLNRLTADVIARMP